ncbi:MAG: divalent-cation tolerance protein CutA [Pseudomonadota bacterium]|nr:divalent-cation tolerance protein CutA [Pseudomonadota bacterium]
MIATPPSKIIVVFTSCPSELSAITLSENIIENSLAACVKVIPNETSVYLWEGEIVKESESLMVIKTLESKFEELEHYISENHDYDIPEIVALSVEKANPRYIKWVEKCLS